MNKNLRQVEALAEVINEYVALENVINNLPRGYISVKHISGKVYCYRQWREGNKIISVYVPEALLAGVKRKIAARKENEALLKVVKKELKKAEHKVLKEGLLNEADIEELKQAAKDGTDVVALAQEKAK